MSFEHFTPMGGFTPENVGKKFEERESTMEISNNVFDMVLAGNIEEVENKILTLDSAVQDGLKEQAKGRILQRIGEGDLDSAIKMQDFFNCYDNFIENENIIKSINSTIDNLSKDPRNNEKVRNLYEFFRLKNKDSRFFEKEEGFNEMVKRTKDLMDTKEENVLTEIAGGSASGKTSFAADNLYQKFKDNALKISMDDYYKGVSYMKQEEEKGNVLNFDQPEAIDLELLKEHLNKLKNGESIEKPIYSFITGEREGYETIEPSKLIILEGLFAIDDKIKNEADLRVFVNTSPHGRLLRRLLRDVTRTGQNPKDIMSYFIKVVEPMHKEYIQKSENNADIIIQNEYNPEIEAERSNFKEKQAKISKTFSSEELRKMGAEKISKTVQEDYYYQDKDSSGETLRVRKENDNFTFTYKGPVAKDSEIRTKNKFEFDIDEETKDLMNNFYGEPVQTIIKNREIYNLNGTIFSQDQVSLRGDDGKIKKVGDYLEIRVGGNENIQEILNKLGASDEPIIKSSYFDICNSRKFDKVKF